MEDRHVAPATRGVMERWWPACIQPRPLRPELIELASQQLETLEYSKVIILRQAEGRQDWRRGSVERIVVWAAIWRAFRGLV